MNIGKNWKFLELKARDGDAGAIAHLQSAVPQSAFLFDAFLVLSHGRVDGKILVSEILRYIEHLGITSDDQQLRFIRGIQSLDLASRS